ncbi:hypothetical protein GS966_28810 [Rhodococcus hoagii]|nr:hypothetical protein [Prescottella equi]
MTTLAARPEQGCVANPAAAGASGSDLPTPALKPLPPLIDPELPPEPPELNGPALPSLPVMMDTEPPEPPRILYVREPLP